MSHISKELISKAAEFFRVVGDELAAESASY